MEISAQFVGTATMLLRIGPLHLLTDPVFDPPGQVARFGFGTSSRKLEGPAVPPSDLPPIDAVLLSHDEHEDNLDASGRDVLAAAREVLTTRSGARRVAGAVGLAPFEEHVVERDGVRVRIRATPARHGPPLSRPFVGAVIGFLIEWEGQVGGAFYVSGDTVPFAGLRRIKEHVRVGTAFLHLGGAAFFPRFVRFTMRAHEAADVTQTLGARWVLPLHYRGWTHFRDDVGQLGPALRARGLEERLVAWEPGDRVCWDSAGRPQRVTLAQT